MISEIFSGERICKYWTMDVKQQNYWIKLHNIIIIKPRRPKKDLVGRVLGPVTEIYSYPETRAHMFANDPHGN